MKIYAEMPLDLEQSIDDLREAHDSFVSKIPSEAYKEDKKLRNGELKKLIRYWDEPMDRLEELREGAYFEVGIFEYLFCNPELKLSDEVGKNIKLCNERMELVLKHLHQHYDVK